MREPSAYEDLQQDIPSVTNIDKSVFTFFTNQLKQYKWLLGAIFFMLLLASSTLLTIGVGIKWLIDKGLFAKDHTHLTYAMGLFLGSISLMACASFGRLVLVNRLAEKVICSLRASLFERLLFAPTPFLERYKSGELLSRLTTDLNVLHTFISTSLPIAFRNFFILCGGVMMLFIMAPQLAFHVLILVPCVVLPIIYFGRHVKKFSQKTQTALGILNSFAEESITALKVIQAFGREYFFLKRFQEHNEHVFHAATQMSVRRGMMVFFIILIAFGAIGFVLWYGGQRMLAGELSGGALTSFIFYAMTVAGTFNAFSEIFSDFFKSAGAASRLQELLGLPLPEQKKILAQNLKAPSQAGLTFRNISFTYPSRQDCPALQNFSIHIDKGETVALVGPSGAGKSTIFQLLLGFYTPQKGKVFIDNKEISSFTAQDLRLFFSYVPQDPTIFSGSIFDNLCFGNQATTPEDIQQAAKQADLHAFITSLPMGYQTQVGERGLKLSGGQKQRIAIARALLKKAPILLLDEATSSLDTATEKRVQQSLEKLYQQQTTLVIAHRLSTIQNADRILVIDKGEIVEEGTHKSLIQKKGLYYSLVKVQFTGQ